MCEDTNDKVSSQVRGQHYAIVSHYTGVTGNY